MNHQNPLKLDDGRRLMRQFVVGMLWVSVLAAMVAAGTNTAFWIVLSAMVVAVFTAGAVALFWMARWAERDARGGQFGIATLLLGNAYVAGFLAFVRWCLVAARQAQLERYPSVDLAFRTDQTVLEFAAAAMAALVVLSISLPILLGLLDSMMWMAVWLVGRPWVKTLLRGRSRGPTT